MSDQFDWIISQVSGTFAMDLMGLNSLHKSSGRNESKYLISIEYNSNGFINIS